MPRKRTNDEFIRELHIKLPNIVPLEEYKNGHTKIKCVCMVHGSRVKVHPRGCF